MRLTKLAIFGLLAAILATPAGAQTTPSKSTTATPQASTSSASTLVDINTASAAQLNALPGIGEARAAAIIKNRPYARKDELQSRHILSPNVYNGIKDKIVARKL